ncbi:MAG: hypothetical protein LBU97_03790 [Alistipes sp.]|jgi:hypothetical protein|nr:hypothetical protein [Alistipes sp.]
MKLTSKIITGLLVLLGFAGCRPEDPDDIKCLESYGVRSAQFEQKHLPDAEESPALKDVPVEELQESDNDNE